MKLLSSWRCLSGNLFLHICSLCKQNQIAFAQAIISRTFDNDDVDSDNDHSNVDYDDPSINDGERLCRMR